MQVMAIGTLALCYNNPRVFTGKPLPLPNACTLSPLTVNMGIIAVWLSQTGYH